MRKGRRLEVLKRADRVTLAKTWRFSLDIGHHAVRIGYESGVRTYPEDHSALSNSY